MWTTRRSFLLGTAALTGTLHWPGALRAATTRPGHKFIFVFARGGWDTTRSLSPMFHEPGIDTEPDAARATAGNIPYVDHPDRPAVRRFFDRWHDRTAVLDGMLVRSVNHGVCERLVMTGQAKSDGIDWPTRLGAAMGSEYALPSIVLNGPSVSGDLHRFSSIVGEADQLQGLLDGGVFDRGNLEVTAPSPVLSAMAEDVLAERVARRLSDASDPGRVRMLDAHDDALARLRRFRADAEQVNFTGQLLNAQADIAVDLLTQGVSRCVTIAQFGWDTHAFNSAQSGQTQDFFSSIDRLVDQLSSRPGATSASLLDETTVVVLSEMGRTPYLNRSQGKDHWPYTAAMLIGGGIAGDRRLGDYDGFLNGKPIDLVSGALATAGTAVTPGNLGATLLHLADIDPAEAVDEAPILALLS